MSWSESFLHFQSLFRRLFSLVLRLTTHLCASPFPLTRPQPIYELFQSCYDNFTLFIRFLSLLIRCTAHFWACSIILTLSKLISYSFFYYILIFTPYIIQRIKITKKRSIFIALLFLYWGTRWFGGWGTELQTGRSRDRFPMVSGIFHWQNPTGRTMALGSTQPLTEMSTRNISWG
jgi:hypothetical protein